MRFQRACDVWLFAESEVVIPSRLLFFSDRTVRTMSAHRHREGMPVAKLAKHCADCLAFDQAWNRANREAVKESWDKELVTV